MSSIKNFAKFKTSCEAFATVPRKKYETLKYKYKCLKQLFKIYDTNVQLTYAQDGRNGARRQCQGRDVYVQADIEELDNTEICPTTINPSRSTYFDVPKERAITDSNYRSDIGEIVPEDLISGSPVCINYVQEYRSTPFDLKPTVAESCCERPVYRTRKTIGLVRFFSKICGGDAQSCTNDGTFNKRNGSKRRRKKRRRRKRSLITLF